MVIRSPLSEGHTLVPLRMAAVRDAVCSVEQGAEPRGVRAAAWRRWPLCLCQWNMVGGISAPTELESREASLSASTQGTHPGEGGSGAENQPPSANEARALAWQGLVWVASGMLWGEYVDERAWGLDTLLTSTWGGGAVSAAAALTISEQSDPVLKADFMFRTTSAKQCPTRHRLTLCDSQPDAKLTLSRSGGNPLPRWGPVPCPHSPGGHS